MTAPIPAAFSAPERGSRIRFSCMEWRRTGAPNRTLSRFPENQGERTGTERGWGSEDAPKLTCRRETKVLQ